MRRVIGLGQTRRVRAARTVSAAIMISAITNREHLAFKVFLAAALLFILVFVEYRTYYVRINGGKIRRGSMLHAKTFPLTDVDLVQLIRGAHSERILYIRHSDTILLKVFGELDGFDDLAGFLREYAKHHHILFATRDGWGEWS